MKAKEMRAMKRNKDAMSWVKSIQGRSKDERKGSLEAKLGNQRRVSAVDVEKKLEITPVAKEMLEQSDTLDFNIFDFKDETEEREIFTLSSYLLQKHGLFESLKIDPEVYFRFIKRIQDYYNPKWIEYHNKTHGADV